MELFSRAFPVVDLLLLMMKTEIYKEKLILESNGILVILKSFLRVMLKTKPDKVLFFFSV